MASSRRRCAALSRRCRKRRAGAAALSIGMVGEANCPLGVGNARAPTDGGPAPTMANALLIAPELGDQIVRDRARLVGRRHAVALEHVGDDAVPVVLLPWRRRDPLE